RFGTMSNETYLSPFFRVRAPAHVAEQAVAALVSWNGGLFVFWPTLVLPIIVAAMALRRSDRRARFRLTLIAAAFGAFLLGVAMWFSPFGWHAWGPRLLLPIVPAAVLGILIVADARIWPAAPVWVVAAVTVLLSVPNVAVLTAQDRVVSFMNPPRACHVEEHAEDPFVDCTMRAAYQRPLLATQVLRGLRDARTAALAAVTVFVACLFLARGGRRSMQVRGAPASPR
ncbi:MAG TPA: hypothetical protein VGB03_00195, partial [Acidimicrobiales bacterium]